MLKDFLKKLDHKNAMPYHVDSWDKDIYIKSWTGLDRGILTAWHEKHKSTPEKLTEFNAQVIIATVVDENGKPEFTKDDVKFIMELDAKTTDQIAKACLEHNGLGQEKIFEKN